MRETEAVLADTGISVLEVEVMLLTPGRDVREFGPVFEASARLGVGNVKAANEVVTAAAQPNGGVLLDPFHLFRSGGTVQDIASIDPTRLRYAQFCDAPPVAPPTVQAISEEARFERLFPGEGGLPLREFLHALPAGIPLGLEVPTRELARSLGPVERAARALRAAKAVVASG
jgi:sugar phosphate isomerase/epimerase